MATITNMPTAITERRVVLVTGGNSGVGLECCRALVQEPRTHVILVGRSPERVEEAVAAVSRQAHHESSVEGRVTDISRLMAVRELVKFLVTSYRDQRLFAVVCNAGVESAPVPLTQEGFETTFATNHLGHFLLVTALYDHGMFLPGADARVVIVSSNLHNPEGGRSTNGPDVSDWPRVAYGGEGWGGMRAYVTSKLCNVLFGFEFQRRQGDKGDVKVFMYSPGFVPDTGLFRNHSTVGWWLVKSLLKVAALFRASLQSSMSTPERSGAFLARLARDTSLPWDSGSYFSIDHLFHTSEQSRDPKLAQELWDLSMECIANAAGVEAPVS